MFPMVIQKLNVRRDLFHMPTARMTFKRFKKFSLKSVLFREFSGFHAGTFNDFVVFTK